MGKIGLIVKPAFYTDILLYYTNIACFHTDMPQYKSTDSVASIAY